jgi:CHAT domain-containing protein
MNVIKRLCLIIAIALAMDTSIIAPAFPQQGDVAALNAGARALLLSHWSVDSEATTRLTTSTFAIMKADPKLGRAEALGNAMLAYMNDKGSPLNGYPAFWGPFFILGEGEVR